MADLKRCPFCGGDAETEVEMSSFMGGSGRVIFSVYCKKCGTRKTVGMDLKPYRNFAEIENAMCEAIEKWNRRVEDGTD